MRNLKRGVINSGSSKLLGGAGTYLQLQKDREQLLTVFPNSVMKPLSA